MLGKNYFVYKKISYTCNHNNYVSCPWGFMLSTRDNMFLTWDKFLIWDNMLAQIYVILSGAMSCAIGNFCLVSL